LGGRSHGLDPSSRSDPRRRCGISRLIGAGTHQRLKTHLAEIIDPEVKEHRGRIAGLAPGIRTTGEGA
jgi:hypothetical protein